MQRSLGLFKKQDSVWRYKSTTYIQQLSFFFSRMRKKRESTAMAALQMKGLVGFWEAQPGAFFSCADIFFGALGFGLVDDEQPGEE
jgi:hypothetical protein